VAEQNDNTPTTDVTRAQPMSDMTVLPPDSGFLGISARHGECAEGDGDAVPLLRQVAGSESLCRQIAFYVRKEIPC
jgi:hypothetical protein